MVLPAEAPGETSGNAIVVADAGVCECDEFGLSDLPIP